MTAAPTIPPTGITSTAVPAAHSRIVSVVSGNSTQPVIFLNKYRKSLFTTSLSSPVAKYTCDVSVHAKASFGATTEDSQQLLIITDCRKIENDPQVIGLGVQKRMRDAILQSNLDTFDILNISSDELNVGCPELLSKSVGSILNRKTSCNSQSAAYSPTVSLASTPNKSCFTSVTPRGQIAGHRFQLDRGPAETVSNASLITDTPDSHGTVAGLNSEIAHTEAPQKTVKCGSVCKLRSDYEIVSTPTILPLVSTPANSSIISPLTRSRAMHSSPFNQNLQFIEQNLHLDKVHSVQQEQMTAKEKDTMRRRKMFESKSYFFNSIRNRLEKGSISSSEASLPNNFGSPRKELKGQMAVPLPGMSPPVFISQLGESSSKLCKGRINYGFNPIDEPASASVASVHNSSGSAYATNVLLNSGNSDLSLKHTDKTIISKYITTSIESNYPAESITDEEDVVSTSSQTLKFGVLKSNRSGNRSWKPSRSNLFSNFYLSLSTGALKSRFSSKESVAPNSRNSTCNSLEGFTGMSATNSGRGTLRCVRSYKSLSNVLSKAYCNEELSYSNDDLVSYRRAVAGSQLFSHLIADKTVYDKKRIPRKPSVGDKNLMDESSLICAVNGEADNSNRSLSINNSATPSSWPESDAIDSVKSAKPKRRDSILNRGIKRMTSIAKLNRKKTIPSPKLVLDLSSVFGGNGNRGWGPRPGSLAEDAIVVPETDTYLTISVQRISQNAAHNLKRQTNKLQTFLCSANREEHNFTPSYYEFALMGVRKDYIQVWVNSDVANNNNSIHVTPATLRGKTNTNLSLSNDVVNSSTLPRPRIRSFVYSYDESDSDDSLFLPNSRIPVHKDKLNNHFLHPGLKSDENFEECEHIYSVPDNV